MKNTKLFSFFLVVVLFLAASVGAYSQTATVRGNYPDGKIPAGFTTDTPGDSCNGAGLEQHDGSIHANGYTQFTDSVRFVIKFHPPSYPWVYTNVCCAFTRTASGPTSMPYKIIVYDTLGAGGSPGNILQVIGGQTASPNIFPSYAWNSTTVNIPVSSTLGAVYIGYVYNNTAGSAFYCTADESSPLWPGYGATNTTFPASWATIQTMGGGIFPNYKCMAIRTQGNSAISPLCEQFANATFPPAGWTEVFSGTNYWTRVTQSGFGLGTGAARWDCWNASTGTRQTLFSPDFVPATGTASSLNIDVAYQVFGSAQDSIIIASSTNGGTTYTSLARLGPVQLASATGATSPFTPTASQWKKLNFVLPTGTNKIQVQGYSNFGDCAYVDSICVNYVPLGIGNNNNGVPQVYSLNQNYPNPFNPSTQISFGLPKAGNVKLVVFDILGREVKTLVNEFQTAGTHNVTFDASSLASGIYFYSITANDFTATKKMLLVK